MDINKLLENIDIVQKRKALIKSSIKLIDEKKPVSLTQQEQQTIDNFCYFIIDNKNLSVIDDQQVLFYTWEKCFNEYGELHDYIKNIVNNLNTDGYSPLHSARLADPSFIETLLCQKNINKNIRNKAGNCPIHELSQSLTYGYSKKTSDNEERLLIFAHNGANMDLLNNNNQSIEDIIVSNKYVERGTFDHLKFLIEYNMNVIGDEKPLYGWDLYFENNKPTYKLKEIIETNGIKWKSIFDNNRNTYVGKILNDFINRKKQSDKEEYKNYYFENMTKIDSMIELRSSNKDNIFLIRYSDRADTNIISYLYNDEITHTIILEDKIVGFYFYEATTDINRSITVKKNYWDTIDELIDNFLKEKHPIELYKNQKQYIENN